MASICKEHETGETFDKGIVRSSAGEKERQHSPWSYHARGSCIQSSNAHHLLPAAEWKMADHGTPDYGREPNGRFEAKQINHPADLGAAWSPMKPVYHSHGTMSRKSSGNRQNSRLSRAPSGVPRCASRSGERRSLDDAVCWRKRQRAHRLGRNRGCDAFKGAEGASAAGPLRAAHCPRGSPQLMW